MTLRQVAPRQANHDVRLKVRDLVGGRVGRRIFGPLDLDLSPGQVVELRGPNGAGKSTLLLTLAGLIPRLSGTIDIRGHDPEAPLPLALLGHRNAVRARLSLFETLSFFSALDGGAGLDPVTALDRVGLVRLRDRDAGQLSQGQQRRLGFARLLVAPRPVWLLDEPTAGLDRDGEMRIAHLIEDHLGAGGSALVATHLDLAFRTAPRRLDLETDR